MCLIVLGCGRIAAAQTIVVTNVDELYDAVNDPANAGATVVLAPGTYVLSVNDAQNLPRPNAGRIHFQPDMSLKGVEGNPGAVVIDAGNLPASSFPANGIPAGPNAAVRMGLGRNTLEWLTVRDARNAQANIDTGLQALDPGPAVVRIAHVVSTGSVRGLNVLNFGPATSGQVMEAEIVDCRFFDNTFNLSEGVRLGNFQGARGATVNARMSGNLSWGQKQGRLIVNNRAVDSTVNVRSSGNRFYDNGGGTIVVGGLSSNNTRADGNTITLVAHGDQFLGNTRETEFDHGGLVALGTEDISEIGGGSHNTVHIVLWGCRMAGNELADLVAIGARWTSASGAGLSVNNRVTIEVHDEGGGHGRWQPVELVMDSVPEGPYGNMATVTH
ncbi:MAG TPA: hypothetical protein VF198_17265 [Vicinamibacterales bacterium]